MLKFFVKRFGYLLLTMLAVSLIIFTINEYSPGQVARKILGPYAPENSVQILTVQMGLDRPLLVRYVDWLSHILRGDLGKSTLWGADVSSIIWDRLLNTSIIASIAFAIIVPAPSSSASRRGCGKAPGWIAPYRSPASSPPPCRNSPPASSCRASS
jgi:ABC-type dipeptide/oligopeptide/nickel transport systems, permease components